MMDFIPQIEPWIDDNELNHLKRLIDNKYVVENLLTKEFEDLVKNHTSSKYALSMTNGTMALFSCLKSLNIGVGDEVIVPNLTFIATSNAVIMSGATPILCDVEEKSMCLDTQKIINLITKRTKAIMPVHLYGNASDMNTIMQIAKSYNLKVIEDAAQGVGVKLNNKHVGTIGDCGVLSYYGNKTITCGEGGIILTNNEEIYKDCYRLKNHGRDKKGIFKHEHIGYNFAFTEMQAAIGISQMEKLDKIIEKKKQIHDYYVSELKFIGDIKFQQFSNNVNPVHWFTSFFTSFKTDLSDFLLKNNIQSRDFFYPLNLQPCYNNPNSPVNTKGDFSISEKLYNTGISLPSSYNLTIDQQKYIVKKIKEFFNDKNTPSQ